MKLMEYAKKPVMFIRGFTIVELMVVVVIIAILAALAIPSYTRYIRKANRGEAQQLLMNWANNQEIWRANNTTYADTAGIGAPTHDRYTFTISNITTTTYTLTADPTGDEQVKDEEQATPCDPLTLDQSNGKTPAVCW
jgi:type IV pilus assembly protein PilE